MHPCMIRRPGMNVTKKPIFVNSEIAREDFFSHKEKISLHKEEDVACVENAEFDDVTNEHGMNQVKFLIGRRMILMRS